MLASVYSYDTSLHALAYKPVAKKVHAILAPLDEEFRITRSLPDDPLSRLKPLPSHPPNFIPGVRFTQEHTDNLDLDCANWLWPDKVKLVHWIVLKHKMAVTWIPTEHSRLDERYVPPVKFLLYLILLGCYKIFLYLHLCGLTPYRLLKIGSPLASTSHQLLPIGCTGSAFSSRMVNPYASFTTCNPSMWPQSRTCPRLHLLST